jgi:hypothetical protein
VHTHAHTRCCGGWLLWMLVAPPGCP